MGLLGAVIFSVIISLLNTSKLLYVLSTSVASFFIVLFITRVFDRQEGWSKWSWRNWKSGRKPRTSS